MWWPSFMAVLKDLWRFCVYKEEALFIDQSINQLGHSTRTSEAVVAGRKTFVQLLPDVLYTSNHAVTQTIREKLGQYDAHLVQKADLTPREWLLYTVHSKRDSVPLLALQMTPIGSWHTTLKGLLGVTAGITPYTGALMEWGTDPQTGTTAVVLEVTPAETITVGELGLSKNGLYTKRVLPKGEWLELRPVFTTIQ
jgi:hypothetical protein